MANKPVPVYWDSCVYISAIQKEEGRYDAIRQVMTLVESGEIVLVASALVIAEVVKLDKSNAEARAQQELITDFFENDYINVRNADRAIARRALEIQWQFPAIKPPDAIHIATALEFGCQELHTYDGENGGTRKMLAFNAMIGRPAIPIVPPRVPEAIADKQRAKSTSQQEDRRQMRLLILNDEDSGEQRAEV